MKRTLLLTAAIVLGTAVTAQQGNPGSHFMETWDENQDGQVTLIEATQRRSDIFLTFDEDDNGILFASDYAMFDEARTENKASMRQSGQSQGQGKAQRQGKGPGQGRGNGQAQGRDGQGMSMEFNDINGDGQVSRDEFITRTDQWYAMMDRNNDGSITASDFGRSS